MNFAFQHLDTRHVSRGRFVRRGGPGHRGLALRTAPGRTIHERPTMQFALLIYQPDPFDPKAHSEAEHEAIGAEYGAVSATPGVTPGLPLGVPQRAITVRVAAGETRATPGPFVNAAGAIGGYLLVEAETEEEAVALAARIPAARIGGAVEVRRVETYW